MEKRHGTSSQRTSKGLRALSDLRGMFAWICAAAVFVVLFGGSAFAADLSLYASLGDSTFTYVDTGGVALIPISTMNYSAGSLTYDPYTETIYGISHKFDPRLVTIDPTTGEVTVVAEIVRPGGGTVYMTESLAFNPADSTLYCSCSLNGSDTRSEILASLDPATGEITSIRTFGGTLQTDCDAMAFIDDTLYVIDDPGSGPSYFYRVDHKSSTGNATLIGILNNPRFNNVNDMAFHPGAHILYGVAAPQRLLISIDWHAGVGTMIDTTHTTADFHGGTISGITVGPLSIMTDVVGSAQVPVLTSMHLSNTPNPFNPATTVHFYVPTAGPVALAVYDVVGRRIANLTDAFYGPGEYTATWNGLDDKRGNTPSGVYFARLQAGNFTATRKMVLLR